MGDVMPKPEGASGEVVHTGAQSWRTMYRPGTLAAFGDVFVVVADTSVITGDVIKAVRSGLPSPLYVAMRTGLVRVFMAHHTWAEVPRILAKRAPQEGVDLVAAERMWWGSYVQAVRFVSTAGLPPADPELERSLGVRDASDLPTLRLASLIAPTVVLASDRDLQDIGLAYERWWEVPEVVRKIVAGHGSTELAARAIFGTGYVTVAAIRGVARALQRPPVVIATASIVVAIILARKLWYPHIAREIDRMSPTIRAGFASLQRAVSGMFQEYGAAVLIWTAAQRGRPGRKLVHRVARILATSPKSMTRTEITRRLKNDVNIRGHRVVMDDLYVILRGHQTFCEVTRGRWQLGKADANLDGLALLAAEGPTEPRDANSR